MKFVKIEVQGDGNESQFQYINAETILMFRSATTRERAKAIGVR